MSRSPNSAAVLLVVYILVLVAFFSKAAIGQTTTAASPAGQVFKNLKVLQNTPADSLNQSMHLISGALGVNCEYCHVEMDFPSDKVEKKDKAREMLTMTADLNQRSFMGKQVVTCFTCHQGHAIPTDTPPLPAPGYPPEKKEQTDLPSVSEILSKYIAALGGEQKLKKITSRVITAQQDIPTGPGGVNPLPAEIEISQMAPNFSSRVSKAKGLTLMSGFDGTTAWNLDARGRVSTAVDLEQKRERRAADLYEPLHIQTEYPDLKVEAIESVGPRNAYVLAGQFAPGAQIRLYFDTSSGLLVRRTTAVPTVAGNSPYQEDFDDYRDAGNGVKYPYLIRLEPAGPRTELATHSTIRIQRIQENVAIDSGKFKKPEQKEGLTNR